MQCWSCFRRFFLKSSILCKCLRIFLVLTKKVQLLAFSVPESVPNSKMKDKPVFGSKIKPCFQDKRQEERRFQGWLFRMENGQRPVGCHKSVFAQRADCSKQTMVVVVNYFARNIFMKITAIVSK